MYRVESISHKYTTNGVFLWNLNFAKSLDLKFHLVDEDDSKRDCFLHELDKSQLLGCVDDLIYSISDTQMKLAETIEFVGVSKCFYDNHNTTPLVRVYEMSDDGIFVLPKDRNSDLEWINDTWNIMAIILFYYKSYSSLINKNFDFKGYDSKFIVVDNIIYLTSTRGFGLNITYKYKILNKNEFKSIIAKEILMGTK